ncbi:unnamed protein product [Heligmosomoides polygyrus]|uniref:Sushi domain-containing protein n=1 Tax=Heligmosomoides polygyrus TaxID=6339 RepID=A0A3P8ENA3_HELPZ|nr:unnamed protein product [Heligmosomoides polygyrus]
MHSALALYLPFLVHLIHCQSLECPESRAPSQLAAVAVWTRESNGSLLYRISDEDLTDEGYRRGTADREDVVVLLARSPGSCTLGPCALQLSTNVRESDGVVSHQENVLGIPDGFSDMHNSFYCVRRYGDCGAQRPVFRYTKGFGSSMVYAYSLDPAALFPGYSREGRILCYGWDDSGSVVHALSMEKKCLPINAIANGRVRCRVTYSTGHSAIHSIGTTATLVCDEGYLGGGQSAVLCVKTGWYPASGLGYCVKRNGRFPQGTHVTVLCNIGYDLFGSINAVCEGGRWSRKLAVCQSSFDPKCPSLNTPFPGRITYSSLPPYSPSTTATLVCDLGLAVSGDASLTCTEDGWSPKTGLGDGSTVFIMCNIGYTPQGSMSSLCQNGAWTPTPGSCSMSSPTGSNTVQQPGLNSGSSGGTCVAMAAPQNGYITYSPSGSSEASDFVIA